MARQKQTKPPPKCKAILLCDQVILDQFTGQITIFGLLDEINLDTLPDETGPLTLFLQLVDGIGTYRLTIEIRDLVEGDLVGGLDAEESVDFIERPSSICSASVGIGIFVRPA